MGGDQFILQFLLAFPPGTLAASLPLTALVAVAVIGEEVGTALGKLCGLAVVAGFGAAAVSLGVCAAVVVVLTVIGVACAAAMAARGEERWLRT